MTNLVESIQKNLGHSEVYKIDPNTQDIHIDKKTFGSQALAQAAIPAVLAGLFNHLENPGMSAAILETDSANWMLTIFGSKKDVVISKMAEYASVSTPVASQEAEHIAGEAVRVIREEIPDKKNYRKISAFVAKHKFDVLLYLPASMHMGDLLSNNNLDDQTNKMEGPVSTFLHKIEKQFNSNEQWEERGENKRP